MNCPILGEIIVELKDINHLYTTYADILKGTFNLTEKAFTKMHIFKKERGGSLIVIKGKKNLLGLFTLSFAENNFLELGDLMKINSDFPRETYAKAMESACNFAIKEYKQNGIYIYPNPYAINLEKMAGFKENSLYVRNVSFVFFNLIFLLPFQIYGGKVHKYNKFSRTRIIRRGLKISKTRISYFNLKVFKKTLNKDEDEIFFKLGLLYEFIPNQDFGDPFLVFGDNNFDSKKIGFEFCDNSA